jgi:hypothetical protein
MGRNKGANFAPRRIQGGLVDVASFILARKSAREASAMGNRALPAHER